MSALPLPLTPSLPSELASPVCWLSGADQSTVFQDVGGATRVAPFGAVRRWADKSGGGCHLLFPENAATWPFSGGHLSVVATGPGSFASSPLASISTAYTVVAVWRVTASGGHPFRTTVRSSFALTVWIEGFETDGNLQYSLPSPSSLSVSVGNRRAPARGPPAIGHGGRPVDAHGNGGDRQVPRPLRRTAVVVGQRGDRPGLAVSSQLPGGERGREERSIARGARSTRPRLPQPAELMVWNQALSSAEQSALSTYLSALWGVGLPPSNVATGVRPSLSNPPVNARYLKIRRYMMTDTNVDHRRRSRRWCPRPWLQYRRVIRVRARPPSRRRGRGGDRDLTTRYIPSGPGRPQGRWPGPPPVAGSIYPPAIRGELANVTDGLVFDDCDWHAGWPSSSTEPFGVDFDFGSDVPIVRIDIRTSDYRLARCDFTLLDASNNTVWSQQTGAWSTVTRSRMLFNL